MSSDQYHEPQAALHKLRKCDAVSNDSLQSSTASSLSTAASTAGCSTPRQSGTNKKIIDVCIIYRLIKIDLLFDINCSFFKNRGKYFKAIVRNEIENSNKIENLYIKLENKVYKAGNLLHSFNSVLSVTKKACLVFSLSH